MVSIRRIGVSPSAELFFYTRNDYWARSLGFLVPVRTSEPGTLIILPPSSPRSQPEYVLVVVRPGPGCELVPGEPVRTGVWLVGAHCGPSPGFDDLLRHRQATKDMLVETFVPRSTNQACAKRVLTSLASTMYCQPMPRSCWQPLPRAWSARSATPGSAYIYQSTIFLV
jgi:hypothetical protein